MIDRIEKRRIERNMTVKQLSIISGIPEATYNNILKGRSRNPSFDTVRALALAVEMSLDEVVSSIDDGESKFVPTGLHNINQKPVTTQELDNALGILMRHMDRNNETCSDALRTRNEEFERALVAKDAQFDRERESLLETIHNKDKWIRWEFALICLLIAFICIILLIDVLHNDNGWIRRSLSELLTYNHLI